ncbi:MAG: diaminopimelate decarboxylase, partial [Bdellovibrionales bacterium]|nr:diaminopimelate decarboxylase [Bdellovibrionales bacterium]
MRELTLGESEYLARLAGEFGTPLYAYDAACIKSQFRRLSEAFSGSEAEIRYAMKALPNPAVLSLLGTLGSGVDAVSLGELRLALRAGIPKERISFTPSLAPLTDIQAALELGVHVTLDSLSLLEKFGRIVGPGVPCSLRINPHIKAGANEKVQTGHRESKFGISIEQIDETLQVVAESGITVTGLHVHTGSDVAEPEIFLQSADVLFRAADKFKDVEIFDLGGGFKVSYHFGSHDADVEKIGANCARVRDEYISRSGRKARIWLEPGKFLVSAAGFLVVKANIVKNTPYAVFVGVDSGLNHLIRP